MANVRGLSDIREAEAEGAHVHARSRGRRNPFARLFVRFPLATLSICAAHLVAWVVLLFFDAGAWLPHVCTAPYLIQARLQLWRLVSPPCVHRGVLDALADLLLFFLVGARVEARVGSVRLCALLAELSLFTYALGFALAGVWAWTLGFDGFFARCDVGLLPPLLALLTADLRLRASAWVGLFGLVPVPALALPPLLVGLSMLLAWSYLPAMLLLAALLAGFLFWTGAFRFLLPRTRAFVAVERLLPRRLTAWRRFAGAADAPEDGRHFSMRMGEGPPPVTCFCSQRARGRREKARGRPAADELRGAEFAGRPKRAGP